MVSSSHSARIGSVKTSLICSSKLVSSPSLIKHESNAQLFIRSSQNKLPILLQHSLTSALSLASLHLLMAAFFKLLSSLSYLPGFESLSYTKLHTFHSYKSFPKSIRAHP